MKARPITLATEPVVDAETTLVAPRRRVTVLERHIASETLCPYDNLTFHKPGDELTSHHVAAEELLPEHGGLPGRWVFDVTFEPDEEG